MFERFTRSAREAVIGAQEMARDLQSDQIGAEHVLLGTLWHVDGVAAEVVRGVGLDFRTAWQQVESGLDERDAEALRGIGIDLDGIRERVEASFGEGAMNRRPSDGRRRRTRGHIRFTREAKKSLELSLREAIRLGHDYIGTEHILLGLTRSPGEPVENVIKAAGIGPDQLHDQLEARLRQAA